MICATVLKDSKRYQHNLYESQLFGSAFTGNNVNDDIAARIKAYKAGLMVLRHTELGHWGDIHETIGIIHDDILVFARVRRNLEIVSLIVLVDLGIAKLHYS